MKMLKQLLINASVFKWLTRDIIIKALLLQIHNFIIFKFAITKFTITKFFAESKIILYN